MFTTQLPEKQAELSDISDYSNRVLMYQDSFSSTEQKISTHLQIHGITSPNISITQFAQEVGVSVSSVLRYCRRLGYSGFKELKFYIQQEQYSSAVDDLSIHSSDDITTVKKKLSQFANKRIEKTMQCIDDNELNRAIKAILTAKTVYFYGVGSASGIARLAANQFMVMGVRAISQSDQLLNLRTASYLQSDEVMITINYDGCAKSSADALMLAKAAGATTILITCVTDSLSHKYADIVLRIAARNSSNALNIVTFSMCQLALLQTLMIGVWLEDEERFFAQSRCQKAISEMVRYDKRQKEITKSRINGNNDKP